MGERGSQETVPFGLISPGAHQGAGHSQVAILSCGATGERALGPLCGDCGKGGSAGSGQGGPQQLTPVLLQLVSGPSSGSALKLLLEAELAELGLNPDPASCSCVTPARTEPFSASLSLSIK